MKIRLSATVLDHLSGSSMMQQTEEREYVDDESRAVAHKINAARMRANGSVVVDVDRREAAVLFEHADVMAEGAADNCGQPGDPESVWAVADLNAARALMRQINQRRQEEAR